MFAKIKRAQLPRDGNPFDPNLDAENIASTTTNLSLQDPS